MTDIRKRRLGDEVGKRLTPELCHELVTALRSSDAIHDIIAGIDAALPLGLIPETVVEPEPCGGLQ